MSHGISLAITLLTAEKLGFKVDFIDEAKAYFYKGQMPQPSFLGHFEKAANAAQKEVLKANRGDEADKIAESLLDEYIKRTKKP